MVLEKLTSRIKGTRYWSKYGKERLYFNTKTYKDKYCHVKIWLEIINDNIVSELVQSGMSDAWIIKNIGMDIDELLRLKQLTGLASLFANNEFSISEE